MTVTVEDLRDMFQEQILRGALRDDEIVGVWQDCGGGAEAFERLFQQCRDSELAEPAAPRAPGPQDGPELTFEEISSSARPPDLLLFPEAWFRHFVFSSTDSLMREEVVKAVLITFYHWGLLDKGGLEELQGSLRDIWGILDEEGNGSIPRSKFTAADGLRDMMVARFQEKQGRCIRRACKYGRLCWNKGPGHREEFAHPQDPSFRYGRVIFAGGAIPDFGSLLDIFDFFNEEGSRGLSRERFALVLQAAARLMALTRNSDGQGGQGAVGSQNGGSPLNVDGEQAWRDAGGESLGYVDLEHFQEWAAPIARMVFHREIASKPPDLLLFPTGWFKHFSRGTDSLERSEVVKALYATFPKLGKEGVENFMGGVFDAFDTGNGGSISLETFTSQHGLRDFIVSSMAQEQHIRITHACPAGRECEDASRDHNECYAHPGDPHYRFGRVVFPLGVVPDFNCLREVFEFFNDYHEDSKVPFRHLSRERFEMVVRGAAAAGPLKGLGNALQDVGQDVDEAWRVAGGERFGHVNWARFALWADSLALAALGKNLPLGVDLDQRGWGSSRHCSQCECKQFDLDGAHFCTCGHRSGAHRCAAVPALNYLSSCQAFPRHWTEATGLVPVTERAVLKDFRDMLVKAHKTSDNWTRDRGCTKHGVSKCGFDCCSRNKVKVPTRYELVEVLMNQNPQLWSEYRLIRAGMTDERGESAPPKHRVVYPGTGAGPLSVCGDINEWWLFHGSHPAACRQICASSFDLDRSGMGGTPKKEGEAKGEPLYGWGVYLAEHFTKADEYARCEGEAGAKDEIFSVLMCRVMGGRTLVIDTGAIDPAVLKQQVFRGPYHSVLGDRVTKLKKPYREFIVYDKQQVFPEYCIRYRRVYR